MGKAKIDTSLVDRAIIFAVKAHAGAERRGHGYPYIIHPMEAAAICASITPDQEIIAAACLHDVIEDTEITLEEIESEFGPRIAHLVSNETEEALEGSAENTWKARKMAAINRLAAADYDSKIVAMGDKLANMRQIRNDYFAQGDSFWNIFHNNDPAEHEWHYRGLADALAELAQTDAHKEFVRLIDETFSAANKSSK